MIADGSTPSNSLLAAATTTPLPPSASSANKLIAARPDGLGARSSGLTLAIASWVERRT